MPAQSPSKVNRQFADYCCELLSTQGQCAARRMFGGWSIYADGMTLAIIADVGKGEKLWLKGDDVARSRFEAAGCERFTFQMKDRLASMGYYTAPEEAMDSQDAMRPWAALAFECALRARATKPKLARKAAGSGKPSKAPAKRAPAKKPAVKAKRKSPQA